MRVTVVLVALSLLAFATTMVPGAEAAKEPVGPCDSGSLIEVCQIHCINPPCPQYICVNTVERICTAG